jgi:YndJ-like protein
VNNEYVERWERATAVTGTAVWATLAWTAGVGKAPLGVIELLFLFAPLVVVPLGLTLGRKLAPLRHGAVQDATRILQPLVAGMVVISFWLAPGLLSAALVLPWVGFCVVLAVGAGLTLLRDHDRSLVSWAVNVGRMDLVVGGAGLLISRLGARPMGFQEPILLLTAVHFHYTGFATAQLAGALSVYAGRHNRAPRLLLPVVVLVLAMPFAVAAGFVWSGILKVAAVIVLSLSLVVMAGVQFGRARGLEARTARWFLRLSASAVVLGMALAVVCAVGDWLGRDWLVIPRMAGTHGVINGLGFVLFGLLAWVVEFSKAGGLKLQAGGPPAFTRAVSRAGIPRPAAASFFPLRHTVAGPDSSRCPSR